MIILIMKQMHPSIYQFCWHHKQTLDLKDIEIQLKVVFNISQCQQHGRMSWKNHYAEKNDFHEEVLYWKQQENISYFVNRVKLVKHIVCNLWEISLIN